MTDHPADNVTDFATGLLKVQRQESEDDMTPAYIKDAAAGIAKAKEEQAEEQEADEKLRQCGRLPED
jgi:hypothetical protein